MQIIASVLSKVLLPAGKVTSHLPWHYMPYPSP